MPYSPEHKQQSREKMLASAFELFAHQGYEQVTINAISQHAGLTRGAFYNHFSSKQELYREAMTYAALNSKQVDRLDTEGNDICTVISLIENYLSQGHLTQAQPCPLAFLVTDMANQEPEVRTTYTQIFEGITKKMASSFNQIQGGRNNKTKAQALAVLMIGGVAVSRALNNETLTKQVMKACRELAIETASKSST